MKSDEKNQAKSDLLRELETLRAQLDDPDAAELHEDDIPLLLDKVEKVVSGSPDDLEDEELAPEEIAALQAAYRDATTDLEDADARLLEDAVQRLKEDREAIDEVVGDGWQATSISALPGQQSLFDESAESSTDPAPRAESPPPLAPQSSAGAPQRPAALGENPFLPKHIRDRLHERRRMLEDDIAQAASFFPRSSATHSAATSPEHNRRTAHSPSSNSERPHHAVVDELVAEYLPRIEAELRRRLNKLVDDRDAGTERRDD